MSDTLAQIQALVARGESHISDHGYDELSEDGILLGEVLAGVVGAVIVEDYPTAKRGPSILLLQKDASHRPIHVVWGIPRGHDGPAVMVTAYRPDPERWSFDFMRRK